MIRAIARWVLWLSVTAVVLVAGGHTVYYLMHWEWNRASIAGTGFVAGLFIAVTFLLLGRLHQLEQRLDALLAAQEAGRAQTPRTTAPHVAEVEPRPDFPWLSRPPVLLAGLLVAVPRPEADQAVFIPVFLAAGLVLSVVAGIVERVAAFVQGRSAAPPSAQELLQDRPGRALLVPVLGLAVLGAAVGGLYLASHYWSRPIGPGVTTLSVEVDNRGPTTEPREVVEAAGRFCALDTGVGITFAGVADGPAGTTLLRVEPLLDDDAQRRYVGCLEDALLEWHRLTVTGTSLEAADR